MNKLIYQTDKRNIMSYINDLLVSLFFSSLCVLMLFSDKYYIIAIAIILLGLFFIPLLLNIIFFKKISIYENEIGIDWSLFGERKILIENIKRVDLSTSMLLRVLRIVHKKNYFFKFYFLVSALTEDVKVQEVINELLNQEKAYYDVGTRHHNKYEERNSLP